MSEHSEQCALIDWARRMENKHPDLKMLYANANGGFRPKQTGALLKAEGVKKGIPDLTLAVPKFEVRNRSINNKGEVKYTIGGKLLFHGLFIEMKFGKNKLTKDQEKWFIRFRAYGYCVEVCYSFEEARKVICDYLGIEEV